MIAAAEKGARHVPGWQLRYHVTALSPRSERARMAEMGAHHDILPAPLGLTIPQRMVSALIERGSERSSTQANPECSMLDRTAGQLMLARLDALAAELARLRAELIEQMPPPAANG